MTKKHRKSIFSRPFIYTGITVFFLSVFAFSVSQNKLFFLKSSNPSPAFASTQSKLFVATQTFNQDGSPNTDKYVNTSNVWFGNGKSTENSYLGLQFTNVTFPAEGQITKAYLSVTAFQDSWISQSTKLFAENGSNVQIFSNSSLPSSRSLTNASVDYQDNVKWIKDQTYNLPDITNTIKEIAEPGKTKTVNILVKGSGISYGRKFIYGAKSDKAPKLTIEYQTNEVQTEPPTKVPATSTITPTKSVTLVPTFSVTSTPGTSATPTLKLTVVPSVTPQQAGWSLQMGRWAPNPLWDTCTKEQHDAYTVVGPDGKVYPTWHPATGQNGCTFGHEHGSDPKLSKADSSMPAFGYVAEQIGVVEAHAGYKVFYINAGDTVESNVSSKTSTLNARIVVHMGTAGVKRYVEPFHSVEYDFIETDGSGAYGHVQLMADTGNGTGSTCTNPRDGGKDFSTIGCQDPYEIWNGMGAPLYAQGEFTDRYNARGSLGISVAAFDPITTRDPNDNLRVFYSHTYYGRNTATDPTSPAGDFQGCRREAYYGMDLNNVNKPSVVYTDAYGVIKSTQPAPGLLKQELANKVYRPTVIWKKVQNFCGSGIHAPN